MDPQSNHQDLRQTRSLSVPSPQPNFNPRSISNKQSINKKKLIAINKLSWSHRFRSHSLSDLTYLNSALNYKEEFKNNKEEDEEEEEITNGEDELTTRDLSVAKKTSYTRRQNLTLICLALINFGSYLSMSIIAPFFPVEAELKGMSMSVTGYVFSVYALVMFAVSPIIGKLIPHIGVKFTFVSGIFLAAGCNILFGALNYVNDTALFTGLCFLLRGFEAVGSASFFTAACTIVAENFRDDVGSAYGLMETFMGIGMTAGPALGSALYSLGGYQLPFYTLADVVPEDESSSSSSMLKPATFWQLLKLPEIIITGAIVMVLCGIWGFMDPILEPHLREFGVTPKTVGLIFLGMAGSYSITCPIIGKIVDKWGKEVILMATGLILTSVCLFLMGPATIFPFLPRNLTLNVIGLVFMGITIGVGFIPTLQNMLDSAYLRGFDESTVTYGLVSSIFSSASSFGEFVGPAVGGVMFENISFDFAGTVMAFASLLTAAVLIIHRACLSRLVSPNVNNSVTTQKPITSDGEISNCDETTPLISRHRSNSLSV
ncbi:hypothetical protein CHUAL_005895 [Chamberlinius hualienensis]